MCGKGPKKEVRRSLILIGVPDHMIFPSQCRRQCVSNVPELPQAHLPAIAAGYYSSLETRLYPKLGRTCMESILSGLLVKNYGRVCRKKSKSPNHWIFSKEILRPYLSIAAVYYANVILQI